MMFLKTLVICFFLLLSLGYGSKASSLKKDEGKVKGITKEAAKIKAEVKKIEKKISFKNLIHHIDTAKLMKQYVNQQHKLTKGSNYPYNVSHKDKGLSIGAYQPATNFKLKYEVFGWYPYWETNLHKSLNYSLLSTIAYFGYDLDPATGNPSSLHNWETTPVVDSAKANGIKVLLTINNFGESNNITFLNNNTAINALIKQAKHLLKQRAANGVCLDFEGVPHSQKKQYAKFILLLSQELKKSNKDYMVYVAVPSVDWEKSLDFPILIPEVDRFIIMGYGYSGSFSKKASPVAPLQSGSEWAPINLSNSVDYYLSNQIPTSKLILALPYYGIIWETKNATKGSRVKKYIGNRTYDYIKTNVPGTVQYDSISQSAWYSYVTDSSPAQFRQCWFNNDSTLSVKLNFIKSKKLKGMGIWALGFDKGYTDLWAVIAKNLCNTTVITNEALVGTGVNGTSIGSDTTATSSTFWTTITHVEAALQTVTDYKTVLLFIMLFVVIFGGIGFLIAMFQPNTRLFFFRNTVYMIYYASYILLFLIVLFRWLGFINDLSIALTLGFIAGGVAIYFINKIIEKMKRDVP